MAFRPDILAGRAVILVNIEDTIDKQLRGIRTKLRRFSNSMSDIGGDFFRGGTVGVLGAIFPVKEFIEFQDQLLFIQTKLQATDVEMLGLEQTIRDLGKSTSFTSTEVGKAAQKLAQAGFSLAETQETLQAALDLSRGGQVDLSTSTDILANNIRTYNIATADAAEVSSKFITAARLGTLDIVDLNEAIKNSATTFRLLGLDLSTSLALITRLSTASLRGTIAGTSLNRAFQKLASENKKLADVGITLAEDDLKNPLQILTKIEEVLANLNETEGVTFLNKLLGIRGGRGLGGILIQGLGPLDDQIKQISGSMDEARESADKLDSRLGGVLRRGVSSFQEFLLAAGGTSEGPLSKFGESLRQAFNALSSLATSNPEALQTIFLLPPAILAAGAAFLTFGFILNKVTSAITPLISLNGLLFSSIQKIIGGNLQGLQKGKALGKSLGLGKGLSSLNKSKYNITVPFQKGLKSIASLAPKAIAQLARFEAFTKTSKGLFLRPLTVIGGRLGKGASMMGQATMTSLFGAPGLGTAKRGVMGAGIFGKALRDAPAEIKKSRNAYKAAVAGGMIKGADVSMKEFITKLATGTKKGLLRGYIAFFKSNTIRGATHIGNALFGKQFGKNVSLFSTLYKGLQIFSKGNLFRGLGSIFKVNYLAKIISITKGIGNLFRIIGLGLRGLFRFNTIFLIIEALILLGPKIPPIRDFFEKVGTFFKDIANVGRTAGPVIKDIFGGIKDMFTGDLNGGLERVKTGVGDLVDIIQTGLAGAWHKFRMSIDGVVQKLKEVGSGLLQILNTLIEVVAQVGGVAINKVASGFGKVFGGEGESPFSRENLHMFFAGVIEAIKVVGIQIIKFIDIVSKIADMFRQAIVALLRAISVLPGGGAAKDTLAGFAPEETRLQARLDLLLARKAKAQINNNAANQMVIAGYDKEISYLKNRLLELRGPSKEAMDNTKGAIDAINGLARFIPPTHTTPNAPETLAQRQFNEKWMTAFDPFIAFGNAISKDLPAIHEGIKEFGESGFIPTAFETFAEEQARIRAAASIPDEDIEALLGPGDLGKAAINLDKVSRAIASTVGSFANTRGQLLKVGQTKDKLDKERNATLKNIEKKVETGVFL